jgi:hypothetical protein
MIGEDAAYDTIVVTRKTTEELAETCFRLARGVPGGAWTRKNGDAGQQAGRSRALTSTARFLPK